MKATHLIASAMLTLASLAAHAQFVKGNEAVKLMPDGSRRVETPPLPRSLPEPCPAARDGCVMAGWKMVETRQGLMECTEIYARPTTCRPSTYGTEKRFRMWIVKSGSQWMQCQHPSLTGKCVSTKELPYGALQ
jgi:hypothetical protein